MDTLVSQAGRFPLPRLVRDLHPLDDTHAGLRGQNKMWKRLDEVRESRKPYKQRSLESLRGSENETKGKNEM